MTETIVEDVGHDYRKMMIDMVKKL